MRGNKEVGLDQRGVSEWEAVLLRVPRCAEWDNGEINEKRQEADWQPRVTAHLNYNVSA